MYSSAINPPFRVQCAKHIHEHPLISPPRESALDPIDTAIEAGDGAMGTMRESEEGHWIMQRTMPTSTTTMQSTTNRTRIHITRPTNLRPTNQKKKHRHSTVVNPSRILLSRTILTFITFAMRRVLRDLRVSKSLTPTSYRSSNESTKPTRTKKAPPNENEIDCDHPAYSY
jgi:hypothetical protein